MQAHDATRGVGTLPRPGKQLELLLAVAAAVMVMAVLALLTPAYTPPTSGVGAEDAGLKAGAGTAIVHDDAGNMPSERYLPLPHGKVVTAGVGSAVLHDDAGNMPAAVGGAAIIHDDAGNVGF